MSQDLNKTCPSCGVRFVCKANAIATCQCVSVSLSDVARAQLSIHFRDCLCADCLLQFSNDPDGLLADVKNRIFNDTYTK
jgi:hypothetical protein